MLFVILALVCTQQVKRVVAAGDGAEASGRVWAVRVHRLLGGRDHGRPADGLPGVLSGLG